MPPQRLRISFQAINYWTVFLLISSVFLPPNSNRTFERAATFIREKHFCPWSIPVSVWDLSAIFLWEKSERSTSNRGVKSFWSWHVENVKNFRAKLTSCFSFKNSLSSLVEFKMLVSVYKRILPLTFFGDTYWVSTASNFKQLAFQIDLLLYESRLRQKRQKTFEIR